MTNPVKFYESAGGGGMQESPDGLYVKMDKIDKANYQRFVNAAINLEECGKGGYQSRIAQLEAAAVVFVNGMYEI